MTNEQRKKIQELRGHGYGYATIAGAIGLSKDSVKAFCRKNNLGGVVAETNARIDLTCGVCLNCGKQLQQAPGRKKIKFCSAGCRQQWWNAHPEAVQQKAVYAFTCARCGKTFTAYGNAERKYCSHACYIAARFKGGEPV